MVNRLLWLIYLSLLAVVMPHCAWAFASFEPQTAIGTATAWCAAFAFEAAIAVLTHKLASHIRSVSTGKRKFTRRYVNAYAGGLLVAAGVSTLANTAHAIEYSTPLLIFGSGSALPAIHSIAFGAILPFVSILFARVLSGVVDEGMVDPDLIAEKETSKKLRSQLREIRSDLEKSQASVAAFGDVAELFGATASGRVQAATQIWPGEAQVFYAAVAKCSPSTVSQAMKDNGRGNHE